MSLFDKLKKGLVKTRSGIVNSIKGLLKSFKKIDEELFDEIEEILISSDVGVETTEKLMEGLRERVKESKIKEPDEIITLLKQSMLDILLQGETKEEMTYPAVITLIGVNGVGKTTTVGKLASKFIHEKKTVQIAAADTFRAAAIEQLAVWGERSGVKVIRHDEGSDPCAVVFDALQSAKTKGTDVLLCDTAGRLHNKKNLMNELDKIGRIIQREHPDARKETWIVIDATSGQNAFIQAKLFNEAAPATGIVITKLDGTAKGGILLQICNELKIPVKYIGVGEGTDDLQPFDARSFVDALFDEM